MCDATAMTSNLLSVMKSCEGGHVDLWKHDFIFATFPREVLESIAVHVPPMIFDTYREYMSREYKTTASLLYSQFILYDLN